MAPNKFEGSPFGFQTKRFVHTGIHPGIRKGLCTDNNPALGPGAYEVKDSIGSKDNGVNWARAHYVSKMSVIPHVLYRSKWEKEREMKRKLGPGYYNVRDGILELNEKPRSVHGVIYTRDRRFKDTLNINPGPGTYGVDGNPHYYLEENMKKSTSTVGMLDNKASATRDLPLIGCHLGPGTYSHGSFLDDLEKRGAGLRGPYDIFSLDRGKPIMTGHYAVTRNHLGPGHYDLKSGLNDLQTEDKNFVGRFNIAEQYPQYPTERNFLSTISQKIRQPGEPSPCHYDPKLLQKPLTQGATDRLPPFNSSSQRMDRLAQKFFTGNHNPVGPGRYDIQNKNVPDNIKNSYGSVFKSKTRPLDFREYHVLQERLHGGKSNPVYDGYAHSSAPHY